MAMSEEEKVLMQENDLEDSNAFLTVYRRIPYALIRSEIEVGSDEVQREIGQICKYYKIYKRGKNFNVEGTNGDYVPARLKYKMAATLINKEARFLFAEQPDITVVAKGDANQVDENQKNALVVLNDLVTTILEKNKFQDILIKAARDCFIGKRVACLLNFNEEDGVTINFLPSMQFVYETKSSNPNVVTKFVCFIVTRDCVNQADKRIFKKKYTSEIKDGQMTVYLEEDIYDGAGKHISQVTPKCEVKLGFIPAIIFINDGLTGETLGESEVDLLQDYEMWYSKLSNADSDAERKSMNPTKYVVDMDSNSTKNLSTAAGAFWDLGSDQNLENKEVLVGLLEPHMHYSEALKTSLDRIKTTGYEQVDMPNITNESLSGVITSGKALKAIYWPLIVRCKEKMKMWGPQLANMAEMIISGAMCYPNTIKRYTDDIIKPVPYKIVVEQNTPLPEDEIEEKTTDLAEVESQVMSRKSYMKKWRQMTDYDIQDELIQIAYERSIIEDSAFSGRASNGFNGDNKLINGLTNDDFAAAGVNSLKGDGTRGQNSDKSQLKNTLGQQTQPVEQQPSVVQSIQKDVPRLNGTQISALINILGGYKNGTFTRKQAESLLKSMGMDEVYIKALLDEEDQKGVVNVTT